MHQVFKSTLMASVVAAVGMVATSASAQTVLRWNNWLPPTHSQLIGTLQPWFKMVEEATKGRVKIVPTDTSLGAPQRQMDLAVDGVADVVLGIAGYTPGRFKLATVAELPLISESGEARAVPLWDIHKKYFEPKNDEFKGVKLIGLYVGTPGSIMTVKAPVSSPADMAGKKIRVGGGMMDDVNQALGGVNVSVPAGQIYELLSNGVVDGALMGGEGYDSFKLGRLVKYVTTVPGGMYASTWFVAMSNTAWNKLSKEDQAAIESTGGKVFAKLGGTSMDSAEAVGRKNWVTDGVKVTVASPEFQKVIAERTKFLKDRWLADAKALGVNGEAALKEYEDLAKAYKPATLW